jgi:hypothetical protein
MCNVSVETLNNWHKDRPRLLSVIVMGCKVWLNGAKESHVAEVASVVEPPIGAGSIPNVFTLKRTEYKGDPTLVLSPDTRLSAVLVPARRVEGIRPGDLISLEHKNWESSVTCSYRDLRFLVAIVAEPQDDEIAVYLKPL